MLNAQELQLKAVYLCKMENVTGGGRLLVSEDLKEESRNGPASEAPRVGGAGLPRSRNLQSRDVVSNISQKKLGQAPWQQLNWSSATSWLSYGNLSSAQPVPTPRACAGCPW